MATPSKILALFLFAILLTMDVAATGTCTACNQLIFKENKGQWNKNVLYKTEMHYANTYFERTAITYELLDTGDLLKYRGHHPFQIEYKDDAEPVIHGHAFKSTFLGANPNAQRIGADKLDEYFNYFLGKDRSKWTNHVNAYHQVTYKDIYTGIDLKVYSEGINLKYDWIVKVAPYGGSAKPIQIQYEGADKVSLIDHKLVIKTSVGTMIESEPYAYQEIDGKKQKVACEFVLNNEGVVSFEFPDGWDHDHDLIIDPTLIFSTYSGSFADNFGYTATYDSKGNAYSAGSVFSLGYPVTLGAFQVHWAGGWGFYHDSIYLDGSGTDVSITKYKSDGSVRMYSTYLGGRGDELPHSLIVNSNDELFVFGTTASNNFPVTANAYDTVFHGGPDPGLFNGLGVHYIAGSDIFVTHLNFDGTGLIGSTYVGGTANDGLNYPEYQDLNYQYADEVRGAIDIDANDNVYIASCTRSQDFPITTGAYQSIFNGEMDGVVFKMDNSLSNLVWSTYLSGNKKTACYSLTLDNTGNVFVCGGTLSDSFPTTAGTFQPITRGGTAEGFISLLSKNGNSLIRSTLYGTPSYDQLFFVQTDKQDNVYVLGETMDTSSFFSLNALYNKPKSGQYISKFNYTLDTLIWSTRFGTGSGIPDISPTAFLVDVCRSIYVAGWGSNFHLLYNMGPVLSTAGMYVTPDAYQLTTDSNDFYVMVMKDDASAITYATYFGSPVSEDHVDGGTSRFDKKGVIYESVCAGCGGNSAFPTYPANVASHTNNSPNCNNAIFKLDLDLPLVIADFATPPTVCDTFNYQFINRSKIIDTPNTVVTWIFGDGTTSNQLNPYHAYTAPGTYTITLIVVDASSCNGSDTISKQMIIHRNDSVSNLPPLVACLGTSLQIGIPPINDTALTYQWYPSAGLSNTGITNPYVTPTQSTTYELVVTKGNCHSIYLQKVTINRDSLIVKGGSILCPNDTLQLFARDTANQTLSYTWTPAADVLSGANTASPYVKPPSNTTFHVTATNLATGCVYKDSINVTVVSSLQYLAATATPDTIGYGDTTQLNATYAQASSLYWNADSTISSTHIDSPLAYPRVPTTYTVNVTDSNGCKLKKDVTVYIRYTPCASSNLYVPNAFSPNNDGVNDKLYVRGNYIMSLYFTVYDRWGQKMFETRDQNIGWDGTYKGKKLDPAVFGWYAEGTCEQGQKFFKKGNVTLLR